jgi:uncharacterized linocin/CFP29 family protein
MAEYLMRDDAPMSEAVWKAIDNMVATVVKKQLVGRRVVPMVGPLGWGVEVAPLIGFGTEDNIVIAQEIDYIKLQQLEAEFRVRLKHMAMADQTPYPMDLGAVATAAVDIAKQEDTLVLLGLMEGAPTEPLGDWSVPNGPFSAVANAIGNMRNNAFDGPFALIMGHAMYAQLASLREYGQSEIERVERLVEAGIFSSSVMPDNQVLVVSPQSWNMDIVVGQDIATAFVGNEGLSLGFVILETLVLRVKRLGAAVVLS